MEQPEFSVGDAIMCRNSWDQPWQLQRVVRIHPDLGPITSNSAGGVVWVESRKPTPEELEAN